MACITKRRNRYILDFYDSQGKRQRQTLREGTTKKAACRLENSVFIQTGHNLVTTTKKGVTA
ncbi:MAG: hypothetical protein KKA75_00385 [Proteobacteria bacterium]|nr:hypothetical protein [Pseudomonadota bacterium]